MEYNFANADSASMAIAQLSNAAKIAAAEPGGGIKTIVNNDGSVTITAAAEWDAELSVIDPLNNKPRLLMILAEKRWQIETAGIVVNGMAVGTDDRSKILISGAAGRLADAETVKFKVGSSWVDLSGIELRAIEAAVVSHVQSAFAVEAALAAEIEAGTVTTAAQINTAAWPPTA